MPRADRYIVPGQLYHLTHRCHDRQFLLKFARDRDQYRQLLWSRVRSYPISVFAYCLTWHRYGVVDQKGCLSFLGGGTVEEFRTNYQEMIRARLAKDQMEREPEWTESIAVGSREFAEAIARGIAHRQFLECRPLGGGTWILKESLGGT